MKYMGSKARIAAEILPIILKDRKRGQYYAEPFCGGCNTIDKVEGKRIAGDANKYLIAMWKGLQDNLQRPYVIGREMYNLARIEYKLNSNLLYSDFEIGWIGYMASFNGKFFDGGYSGYAKERDYVQEQIRNTEKQIQKIKDIDFIHAEYSSLQIPDNSIIYCDIPYKGTKQYSTQTNFDHDKFWKWANDMKDTGHSIFVSEYNAPEWVECVWSKQVTNSLNTKITYKPTEKLFKL